MTPKILIQFLLARVHLSLFLARCALHRGDKQTANTRLLTACDLLEQALTKMKTI
jgi:hypothetical protein